MPFWDHRWWLRLVIAGVIALGAILLTAICASSLLALGGTSGSGFTLSLALLCASNLVLLTLLCDLISTAYAARDRLDRRRAAMAGYSSAMPHSRVALDLQRQLLSALALPFTWSGTVPIGFAMVLWTLALLILGIALGALGGGAIVVILLAVFVQNDPKLLALTSSWGLPPVTYSPLLLMIPSIAILLAGIVLVLKARALSQSQPFTLTATAEGLIWRYGRRNPRSVAAPWRAMRLLEVQEISPGSPDWSLKKAWIFLLYTDTTVIRWATPANARDTWRPLALIAAYTGLAPRTFDERLYADDATAPVRLSVVNPLDTLYSMLYQLFVAAVITTLPLTTSPKLNAALAYLSIVGVVFFVALSAGAALQRRVVEWRLSRPQPPVALAIALPPRVPGDRYECRSRASAGAAGQILLLCATGLVLGMGALPWLFSELPDSLGIKARLGITGLPNGISDVVDAILLPLAVLGMGFLLMGLVLLFLRVRVWADATGLHSRARARFTSIPWSKAQRLIVTVRGSRVRSYKLLADGGRVIIAWQETGAVRGRRMSSPLPVSARELAALVVAFTGLQPEVRRSGVLYADIQQGIDALTARMDKAIEPLMPGHEK